ncbi:hypothetical protein KFK09_014872 [Dendrobium nobile]|uniref:Retroviral polymerase SH3-like domain-containing protein n=1 Tax=Dendrobium nobile TaxID=94219 RepID=A0A8T3B939_DENNO|nr:hypothetical protein KFK09_014872 [Dendrobium nobile]
MTSKRTPSQTPFEIWSGHKPIVDHLRVFGNISFVHVPDQKRRKLDKKYKKCVFVGYSESSKAYKLYDPITKKVVVNRDVRFEESLTWDWLEKDNKEDAIIMRNSGTNLDDIEQQKPPQIPVRLGESFSNGMAKVKTINLQEIYDTTNYNEELSQFSLYVDDKPLTFSEAITYKRWMDAMKEEIDAIERNDT